MDNSETRPTPPREKSSETEAASERPIAQPETVGGLGVQSTGASARYRSGTYASKLRFWALPDANLKWWIIKENDSGGAEGLLQPVPVIYVPPTHTKERLEAADSCRAWITLRLRDRCHEDAFQLLKRLLLGGVVLIGSSVGLLLPGELKLFDSAFLIGAVLYCVYAGVRYGGRFLASMEAVNHPFTNFIGEPFVENALVERLRRAIEYRRSRPQELRGMSPDEELLDTNAYRRLLREKVVTREELCALGGAVRQRFGVDLTTPRKLSDLMRTEGLDAESAAVYRDLALAAAEIGMAPELPGES